MPEIERKTIWYAVALQQGFKIDDDGRIYMPENEEEDAG